MPHRIKFAPRLKRVIADFDNIELKDIRISSHSPNMIFASVYIDGELNLSADLDLCLKRIKEKVEERVRKIKEKVDKP